MRKISEYPAFVGSWYDVERLGASMDFETYLVLRAFDLPDPRQAGFYWLPGFPKGTLRQWRKRLADGSGVHVYVYNDALVIHRDRVDPSASLLGHLVEDCPGLVTAGLGVGVVGLLAAAAQGER